MLIKFKIFEGVRWWKDGKLGPEEPDNIPEYNDILPDNGFRQFLLDNNCYEDYLYFCRTIGHFKKREDFNKNRRGSWLDDCFGWALTGNGEFWSDMNVKWRTQMNKYPPNMNEGVRWWKDGKLGPEEPDKTEKIKSRFKVGEIICPKGRPNYIYKIREISDDYIKLESPTGKVKHWDIPSFKFFFDIYEGIRWWKDGKLGPEEDIEEENEKDYDEEKMIRDRLEKIKNRKNYYISINDYTRAAYLRDEERKLLKKLGEL